MAQDRMPPIPADKLTDAQKKAQQEIAAGLRGAKGLRGPFVPLLRSPELMTPLQKAGEYLRHRSSLGVKLTEFVVLLIARRWNQEYEWHAHEKSVREAGIAGQTIAAIRERRRPSEMDADQAIVYDFCAQLAETTKVSDEIYGRALSHFGEQGVVDLIGLIGYYSLLAMVLNVAQTPLPDGAKPQLLPPRG